MANKPRTDKQFKRSPTGFSIEFIPGGEQMGFMFNNLDDVRDFVRRFKDGDVEITVDLNQSGSSFLEVPIDEYSLQKVILKGRAMSDGAFPEIILPDGATINPSDTLLRIFQLKLTCQNTNTPIVTPNGFYRVQADLATISAEGSDYFADMSNGGQFSISADRNAGLVNNGGSELVYIPAGGSAIVFLEEDSYVEEDMFELEDSTASLSVFYSLRGRFEPQSLVPAASITKSCLVQTGTLLPAETYSGKLFLKQPENRYYYRNSSDSEWLQFSLLDLQSQEIGVVSTTNILATHNTFSFSPEPLIPHKVTINFAWGGSNTAKDVIVYLDVVGVSTTVYMKQQPRKSDGAGAGNQLQSGVIEFVWTPISTASQTINLSFQAEDNTSTASIYWSVISVEECR
jgi:hypothetical protein